MKSLFDVLYSEFAPGTIFKQENSNTYIEILEEWDNDVTVLYSHSKVTLNWEKSALIQLGYQKID